MKKIIAMTLALIMCLSIVPMVAFAATPTLDSLAIVGENIPGVPTWKPEAPEGDMTKVSEGVYEKILECPAGTNMNFKVAGNDTWDDTCNFGSAVLVLGQKADLECAGGSGNMNLAFTEATTIKITVDVNPMNSDGAATILVEAVTDTDPTDPTDPTEPTTPTDPEEDTEKYTLTVEVPSSWTTVNLYTWTDEPKVEAFGTYPGTAMTKKSDNTYECQIDGNLINLILSNQDTMKTDDLRVDSGKNVKIVVSADGKATISYPSDRLPRPPILHYELSNYRVVGNTDWLGNWDAAFDGGRMYKVSDNLYRKSFENVPPGSYEIKITKDGKWGGDIGDNGANYCFTVDQKSIITVDLTFNGDVGTIEVYGGSVGGFDDGDDQEENPKSGDIPLSLPIALLLFGAAAVPVLLNKRKEIL